MKKFKVIFLTLVLLVIAFPVNATELPGKILLQVERNGEAWYVHPRTNQRHFLYRPEQAYQIMREQGVGITNADLAKIPIGYYQLSGTDSDGDGLTDNFEVAIGTNYGDSDSDDDGFSDGEEVKNGFNPLGQGSVATSPSFAALHAGKIFLQVEDHGEGWWVNPDDNKRYYLGRAQDAFDLMRAFGLGISEDNIGSIQVTDSKMDCGDDETCMIAALELGQLSTVDWETSINFFGAILTSVSYTEIFLSQSIYTLESVVTQASADIDDATKQQLLADGKTEEEIEESVNETNEDVQSSLGDKTTCTFDQKEKLVRYLKQTLEGKFSVSSNLFGGGTKVQDFETKEVLGECTLEEGI